MTVSFQNYLENACLTPDTIRNWNREAGPQVIGKWGGKTVAVDDENVIVPTRVANAYKLAQKLEGMSKAYGDGSSVDSNLPAPKEINNAECIQQLRDVFADKFSGAKTFFSILTLGLNLFYGWLKAKMYRHEKTARAYENLANESVLERADRELSAFKLSKLNLDSLNSHVNKLKSDNALSPGVWRDFDVKIAKDLLAKENDMQQVVNEKFPENSLERAQFTKLIEFLRSVAGSQEAEKVKVDAPQDDQKQGDRVCPERKPKVDFEPGPFNPQQFDPDSSPIASGDSK